MDTSLISNIQKLFHERIEVFGAVEFNKLSIVTGIIKIALKVHVSELPEFEHVHIHVVEEHICCLTNRVHCT